MTKKVKIKILKKGERCRKGLTQIEVKVGRQTRRTCVRRATVLKRVVDKITINPSQMKQAKDTIKKYYRLNRQVTDNEVLAEVKSLRRRQGDWFDGEGYLAACLQVGPHPISMWIKD
jgi:hypothetical protein